MANTGLKAFMRIDHMTYAAEVRIHGRATSALSAIDASTGVRLLKRFAPTLSRVDHAVLADHHARAVLRHRKSWSRVADVASLAAFGRKYSIFDYCISGIACEEFSDEHKDALRRHAYSAGKHHRLAVLHYMAAGHRHASALRYCAACGL